MARCEDEGFYGGAAGGGKSDMLIIEALRQVDKPWYRGLISSLMHICFRVLFFRRISDMEKQIMTITDCTLRQ